MSMYPEWKLVPTPAAGPQKVVLDFERVGMAGPFPVIDGRVAVPAITVRDLIRMATLAADDALATNDELLALLPGTYYMNPPDGGSVGMLEQFQRMARDAARYRFLRDRDGGSIGIAVWDPNHEEVAVLAYEYADATIDAAIAQQSQQQRDA